MTEHITNNNGNHSFIKYDYDYDYEIDLFGHIIIIIKKTQ